MLKVVGNRLETVMVLFRCSLKLVRNQLEIGYRIFWKLVILFFCFRGLGTIKEKQLGLEGVYSVLAVG